MANLIYWYAPTWEGGFGGVYSKTKKDCVAQVKQLTKKGGKFVPTQKIKIEYIDDFDLIMQVFGYAQKEDGCYRPGIKMIRRQ